MTNEMLNLILNKLLSNHEKINEELEALKKYMI